MPFAPARMLTRAQKNIPALAAFEIPAFRRIFAVGILGTFAQGTIFTTLGWVIADETGSEILVSLIAVSFLAPQLVAPPFGGLMADRFDRARLLRVSE